MTELFTATFDDVEKNVPIAVINKWVIRLDDLSKHFPERFTDLQPMRLVKADAVTLETWQSQRIFDLLERLFERGRVIARESSTAEGIRMAQADLQLPTPPSVTIELTEEEAKKITVTVETDGIDKGFGRGFAPLDSIYSLINVPKRIVDELKSQFTPPLVEPKATTTYPKVTAKCPCWATETTWTLGADENWHTCRNGKWDAHVWFALSNPRVIGGAE